MGNRPVGKGIHSHLVGTSVVGSTPGACWGDWGEGREQRPQKAPVPGPGVQLGPAWLISVV